MYSLRPKIFLLVLAGSVTLSLLLLPSGPWLLPDLRPGALLLSGTWTLWRLLAWDCARAQRHAWTHNTGWGLDVGQLAAMGHASQAGLLLGQAFPWHAGHTQALETALATEDALPTAPDARGGLPALHAVGQADEQPLVVPWATLAGHLQVTGTTGSGKSRALEVLAAEAIRAPGAVVIIDPKGDRDLLTRCAAEAHRHQRPFALITPAFPAQSARMNVLATATTPAEVSARIRALMPSAGGRTTDPFYEEYPLALIERLAAVQAILSQPWTLEGLHNVSVLRHHMEQLLDDYLALKGFSATPQGKGRGDPFQHRIHHYKARGPSDPLADALIDDLEKPRDHFTKVTSNLIPAFRGVVGAPLGPLFSTIPGDLTWPRIAAEGMVVYLALAALLIGDIANRIGRVILQDLIGWLGRRYAFEAPETMTPLTVLIDEVAMVAYPGFPTALAMSRGAHTRFILAQQSLADLDAVIGRDHARRVADNCTTKVWLRVADDRTAQDATEGLGPCTVHLPDTGVGLSYGGLGGLSGSSHRRLVAREVPLIRPQWLTALPTGEGFVRMRGEVWKLRVPLLTPVSPATRDILGLTILWNHLQLPLHASTRRQLPQGAS